MSAPSGPKDRRVIPRWREAKTAVQTGEASPINLTDSAEVDHQRKTASLARLSNEFRQHPDIGRAADLASVAQLFDRSELAEDAAEYLLMHQEQTTAAALANARRILELDKLDPRAHVLGDESQTEVDVDVIHAEVRRLRAKLRHFSLNPLAHLDLARVYTALGQFNKAERHIRTALGLAPHHRLVTRTAMRFHLHLGDPQTALRLLYQHPQAAADPWLVAAEISTAMVADQAPKFVRRGRELLDTRRQPPLHLSELAASLGTLELYAGRGKRAKQLFQTSMVQPTENTVAQVRWAQPHMVSDLIGERGVDVPRNFEALAWQQYFNGHFLQARASFMSWLRDEPFSSRPAHMAAFLTDLLDPKPQAAIRLTRLALGADPDDALLLNNLAFYLANVGELEEAELNVQRALQQQPDKSTQVALLATQGLLAFRQGHSVQGEHLYLASVALARKEKDRANELLAQLYLARERFRLGQASPGFEHLMTEVKALAEPGVLLAANKIQHETQQGRLSSTDNDETP
ncbi:hypothetical protein [Deinococcus sonorensis]|uniref:Tetratricopeptide repeat protein n=1 Tax=Deinococcus sonorensis TaxID=309891 RepID=A0ABV8Y8H6_9DEIO